MLRSRRRERDVPFHDRQQLIAGLERVRGSRVLTYVMSDRASHPQVPGFGMLLDGEPFLLLVDHLRSIGRVPKLDLFLYTRGGATDAVWPLVCLLREFTDRLSVLVPFRAHSAGTMIALGADELVLGMLSELSPIDPTTGNQFNPADPTNPANRYGISVEDVTSYFRLAESQAKIKDEASRVEVFNQLTRRVHPLALGNVQRVYLQIRRLAERLLALHLDETSDKMLIENITKALTEEFYSHVHSISRREALPLLGSWARATTAGEEAAMTSLFESYASELELRVKFSLPDYMGTEPVRDLTIRGGFIDSTALSHIYQTHLRVMQRPALPPNIQVQIPPGAPLPLDPWVGRQYDFGLSASSWALNTGGI